jgi:hypothetical protein
MVYVWTAILQYWNTKLPLYFEAASADPIGTIELCAALRSWLLSRKVHFCFPWHDRDILCVYTYHPVFSANYLFFPPPTPSYDCLHVNSVSPCLDLKECRSFLFSRIPFPCSILDFQNYVSMDSLCHHHVICVCVCVWVGNSCTKLFVSLLWLGKELSYALRSC